MKQVILVMVAAMGTSCASVRETSGTEGLKPEPGLQTTCPVMEGKRINSRLYVDYQGYRIYVCCNPCVKAFRKNPEKYLKRLTDQGIVLQKVNQGAVPAKVAEESGKQAMKQSDRQAQKSIQL